MKYLIQIITAYIGSLGFALLFNIKKERILYASIGGIITWCIYLLSFYYCNDIFISNMIASILGTAYSELLARIHKAPTTVFLLPSIVPLVPGGSLYYSMSYAVTGNKIKFDLYALNTLKTSLGIAVGIIVVSVVVYHLTNYKCKRSKI
ncbi:threonine/serine exporter family protein [Clostridium sp. UBA4395]|uniref:threonine/serine exporter family protein n=1 Tax=Clostridium sp. UBA4395 TaxID=1946360 RepID=UPI003217FADD